MKKTTIILLLFFCSVIIFAQPAPISSGKTVRYDLYIADTTVTLGGEESRAIAVNDSIPMPTLTFTEAGFIKLADPDGVNYKNPFTYGFSTGKFLSENGNSILLYFYSYTKILDNYEPPRQLSLGLNIKLNPSMTLSLIGSKGLSD